MKFKASDKGQGFRSGEQNKETGWKPIKCCTCGKYHRMRDCLQNQGGKPYIYSAQEAQTIGDVRESDPCIYAALDNKQVDHQAFIIKMDGNICDQVISIFIDPRSNYSYVSPDLLDKCGLIK